jgi:hypothetical protein
VIFRLSGTGFLTPFVLHGFVRIFFSSAAADNTADNRLNTCDLCDSEILLPFIQLSQSRMVAAPMVDSERAPRHGYTCFSSLDRMVRCDDSSCDCPFSQLSQYSRSVVLPASGSM